MTSTFSWLDFSENERKKALDVIDLFREQDTRDELGIGTVRDAFADLFFPGTSTIQTRAKYFLLIPWIYLDLERLRISSSEVAPRARHEEIKLIDALCESGEGDGVIGIDARSGLKRLPSNIYWLGLRSWGIRLYPGSQDQYHRSLSAFYKGKDQAQRNDDDEPVEGRILRNWHFGLPLPPKGFPKQASLVLTRKEADYLRERIMAHAPGTLLAFLVDLGEHMDGVAFPWEYPQFAQLSSRIREQLNHARNFSEVIHGAQLLYNLMLAQKGQIKNLSDVYQEKMEDWFSQTQSLSDAFANWDRRRFWQVVISGGASIPPSTQFFIDSWIDIALHSKSVGDVIDNARARALIHDREVALKRGLARLENDRALELWGGEAGSAQLTYRWQVTQRIVADILAGLSQDEQDA
jgi:hypothetical protein